MLDNLYENIGSKIKNWAKWIFIIEAIGSIITAIVLPIASGDPDDFILISVLIAIVGPIVAWVGSWILYAFGEFVEKTADNERNTRQILKKLNEKSTDASITFIKNKEYGNKTTNTPQTASTHKWLCDGCKKMRTQTPCEHCGKE
jgi:hypothetical protein